MIQEFLVFLRILWATICTNAESDDHLRGATSSDSETSRPRFCRGDNGNFPSQQIIWQTGFPSNQKPLGLCEGSIDIDDTTGEICVYGRVNYIQLAEAVKSKTNGRIPLVPNLQTNSVPGHLIGGSPNVVRGPERRFLYDFVTRYTINGIPYNATRETLTNNLLAASRGLLDSVCFDQSLAKEREDYSITHQGWRYDKVDVGAAGQASILFVNRFAIIAEYLWQFPSDKPYATFYGNFINTLFTASIDACPGWVFNFVPFLTMAGFIRYFVNGNVNTDDFPTPLVANEVVVDNIQIDTEWTTLLEAMEHHGLFTSRETVVPLYYGIIIKKVIPSTTNPKGCWTVPSAALSINAPPGQGDKLDEYVSQKIIPKLLAVEGGTIGTHVGNRLNSHLMEIAMNKYNTDCRVEINIEPTNNDCYHPACTRSTTLTDFTYPSQYYQFS